MEETKKINDVKMMSIYEALGEIKLLDKEISRMQAAPIEFNSAVVSANVDKETTKDAATKIRAWYDKYFAKLNRLTLLQGLVYQSNNNTEITVGQTIYPSVTMALQKYKNIESEISLWATIVMGLKDTKASIEKKNEKLMESDEEINRKILPAGITLDAEAIQNLKDRYIKDHTYQLFDPIGFDDNDFAVNKLTELKEFREIFHNELNKVNLLTIIEVPIVEPKL